MTGYLILNADDFGFTQGVNDAIFELVEKKALYATNIMMNMPYVEQIVQLKHTPNISIGIHLNITQGHPLMSPNEIPSLVDTNREFFSRPELIRRAKARQINYDDLVKEISAQVKAAKQLVGNGIDHWNSHQGITHYQPMLRAAADILFQHDVPYMRNYRHVFYHPSSSRLRRSLVSLLRHYGFKRFAVELYYTYVMARQARKFRFARGLLSASKMQAHQLIKQFIHFKLPPGVWELPIHPAKTQDELWGTTLLEARVLEYELLSDPDFIQAFEAVGNRLSGYSAIQ